MSYQRNLCNSLCSSKKRVAIPGNLGKIQILPQFLERLFRLPQWCITKLEEPPYLQLKNQE